MWGRGPPPEEQERPGAVGEPLMPPRPVAVPDGRRGCWVKMQPVPLGGWGSGIAGGAPVCRPSRGEARRESLALPAEPVAEAEGWCCARGAEARGRGSLASRPHLRLGGCSEAASAFPPVRCGDAWSPVGLH